MAKKGKATQEKTQELENQLKRALADYANLQKRVEEAKQDFVLLGKAVVLEKLIKVLDTLEKASELKSDGDFAPLKQAVEISIREFQRILEEENVTQLGRQAEEFDPNKHEAVDLTEGDEDNKIASVLEKGYAIGDRVIRPARVQVTKKKEGT
jgi:molecular chaperone GrpE